MTPENFFRLKKPCGNCPFRKEGAIQLEEGRLENIVDGLVTDDWSTFQCHKTVHNEKTGGTWDEEGNYTASGEESMCVGAMIYLEKLGRPTVGMRIGRITGHYDPQVLAPLFDDVLDPKGGDGD